MEKKIKGTHIIIAILAIVVLLQTVTLVQQGRRQTALEKRQDESILARQNAASVMHARTHNAASQAPRAFSQFLVNDDPWESFDQMSRRMSNLMQHAFMFGSPLFQNMPQGAGFDFTPAVDLEETKDAYIVKSDLPGLEKDKINLTVKENILTIEGVRQTANETQDPKTGYYAQERSYGSFARSLSLPGLVDESKIVAEYKNGVLIITLPKAPGQKDAQKVAIQ
ncbi:MAG TPA: Hsp20/alpha crystallin family protein [Candidatus Omnitrophota bacterium]|nr:Hsp20/alpha crystallin family protein [Candidatus Omnitrophota bacterium]